MGAFGEIRAASASVGTALSTTATVIPFLPGTQYALIEGRNYLTAAVARVALVPYLRVFKTADSLATITDYSENAQDGNAATDVTLSSLDTLANGDALWVGSHLPFRGLLADVDAANGTASVLTGTYWNGTALADISLTDGTDSVGATFGQDGAITWSVPAAWTPAPLTTIGSAAGGVQASSQSLYWVRLVVSAALDSSSTLNSLMALSRSTAYAELTSGRLLECSVNRGAGGMAGVEALTDAGTGNLIVNCATVHGGRFV